MPRCRWNYFKEPTVAAMAGYIEFAGSTRKRPVKRPRPASIMRTAAQRRLYILQQMELETTLYNMP